ncbi:MAG: saccharopine dehydrogenase NADP-binding domain-containing protein [Gemmatimonadetes bacterium]|nr:saccharopine dehydrogenase NADP-binding domain-containing protein [Gemmatimonadota bacterium]
MLLLTRLPSRRLTLADYNRAYPSSPLDSDRESGNRVYWVPVDDDDAGLDAALAGVPVVVHAAGPFARTARPMVEACLRTGTHYLDVTAEIEVFERLHALDGRAREAGVMLLPGVGFDVVPTDLVAAHLKARLPGAVRLRLAFQALGGGVSRGTATTMVENAGGGGVVRRDGRIVPVPAAWRTRTVDFGFGFRPVRVTTVPWGDVSTAYHSTGIPDIEVSTRLGRAARWALVASRLLGRLLESGPLRRLATAMVRAGAGGPDEEARRRGVSLIRGEVEDDAGRCAVTRMRTPEAYTLTAMTAVEAARRVLDGSARPGFQTPSLAFGPDWILELEGVAREDGEPADPPAATGGAA